LFRAEIELVEIAVENVLDGRFSTGSKLLEPNGTSAVTGTRHKPR